MDFGMDLNGCYIDLKGFYMDLNGLYINLNGSYIDLNRFEECCGQREGTSEGQIRLYQDERDVTCQDCCDSLGAKWRQFPHETKL